MNFKISQKNIQPTIIFMLIVLIGIPLFFTQIEDPTFAPVKFFNFIGTKITKPVADFLQCGVKIEENKRLRKKNRMLKSKLASMKKLKRENDKLKKELKVKATEEREKIIAEIIGRSADPRGRIALVNKGKSNGVEKGDNVTLAGGILFGQVVNTFEKYSKVVPITNESLSVAALQQENQIEGVLRGRGSILKPVFDLMSPDKELKKGSILTSGLDQKFIPGLLLGELIEIKFYPQESSKRGVLKVPYNFDQVKTVFIISK